MPTNLSYSCSNHTSCSHLCITVDTGPSMRETFSSANDDAPVHARIAQ